MASSSFTTQLPPMAPPAQCFPEEDQAPRPKAQKRNKRKKNQRKQAAMAEQNRN